MTAVAGICFLIWRRAGLPLNSADAHL